jgi:beta-lactamase superfamily II metal-dependent hydrolase
MTADIQIVPNASIVLYRAALEAIFDECDRHEHDETGGRLLGTYHTTDRASLTIEVSGVIEPGPHARRSHSSFFQDGSYQARVFRQVEAEVPEIEHLGNWHTHHVNGFPTLSSGDRATYHRTVNHNEHNTDFFYALLVVARNRELAGERYACKHFIFFRGDPNGYELPSSAVQIVDRPIVWPRGQHSEPTRKNPTAKTLSVDTGYRPFSELSQSEFKRHRRRAMDIFSLYAGQGALTLVRHANEVVFIDSKLPDSDHTPADLMHSKLSAAVGNRAVAGLILTGLDCDHSDPNGVEFILSNFRPAWVMYPKCYKETEAATAVFRLIDKFENGRERTPSPLRRLSVRLDRLESRILEGLSDAFEFELFSPHIEDMTNSNCSSIVLRLTGRGPGGFSYLITGDTENERWDRINVLFQDALRSDVLAAPHHGSKNAINPRTLLLVQPNTVLISAGVDNQFGHPDPQAVRAYQHVAKHVYATNVEGGVSLHTRAAGGDFVTQLFR